MFRKLISAVRAAPAISRSSARVPAGQRVYAVGDIHGRIDLFDALLARIEADDAARAPAETTLVLLGDLVDRGPHSAQVIERTMQLRDSGRFSLRLLLGNHEEVFISAASGDPKGARSLIQIGDITTLTSYGITPEEANEGTFVDLAALLVQRVPREHVRFLKEAGEDWARIGDYLFVHAGIRPGVPLDEQRTSELRWIRGGFLDSNADHGFVVVHGHTITERIEQRPNRIGIDTGAYRSGVLTALALEGEARWVLQTGAAPDEAEFAAPLNVAA